MFLFLVLLLFIGLYVGLAFLIPLPYIWFCLWGPLALILGSLTTVLVVLCGLMIGGHTKPTGKIKRFVLRSGLKLFCFFYGTKLVVHNKENLPKKNGYTIYGNHKSNMDVIFAYLCTNGPTTALGKKSLFGPWIMKKIANCYKALPIDRENDREAAKSIITAIKLVKEGMNMIIFPEGGVKSRETEEMVALRAGAYKVAVKAKAPVVPIAIIGSSKLQNKKFFKHVRIDLYILKPLYYEEYVKLTETEAGLTTAIGLKVEEMINECIKENEGN